METLLVIDNESRHAEGRATFERVHPLSDGIATRAAAASVNDAIAAADAAARAFPSWAKTPNREKQRILLKAADLIESKMDAFIASMRTEIGASELWARINTAGAADLFREAASLANQIQGETLPTSKPGTLSMTVRQPVGAMLSIVPWNGPIVLAARAIAYPLICGNTVVFRASETSPKTHQLLAEAVFEAGLPAGVLNFITNTAEDSAELTDALIEHKAIRRINFTGSTRVGRIIAEKAARQLKPCILELGDKSPLVVLDDASLEDAVNAAVFGAFLYQGQICMSTDRIIVAEEIADAFAARFAERTQELPAGAPVEGTGYIVGPVISDAAGARLNGLVDDAVELGAELLLGGRGWGASMPATVLDRVTPAMRVYHEETFGPVVAIIRAKDDDDAVRIANDTEFGLSAAVFGQDVARAVGVALRIETGSVHVNGATVQHEPQAPYGGTKASGYGRFDGRAVINEFTELKWVTIEPGGQQFPF